jgi:hypothetical protein
MTLAAFGFLMAVGLAASAVAGAAAYIITEMIHDRS